MHCDRPLTYKVPIFNYFLLLLFYDDSGRVVNDNSHTGRTVNESLTRTLTALLEFQNDFLTSHLFYSTGASAAGIAAGTSTTPARRPSLSRSRLLLVLLSLLRCVSTEQRRGSAHARFIVRHPRRYFVVMKSAVVVMMRSTTERPSRRFGKRESSLRKKIKV